jgi:hypothetical protein
MISSFVGYSQNVTPAKAKEIFGERFIEANEAGFPLTPTINFCLEDIQFDRMSWIVPVNNAGIIKYELIQALYRENLQAENEILNMEEAEQVIKTVVKTNRNFPNDDSIRYFRTNSQIYVRDNSSFEKIIACYHDKYKVVELPANTTIVMMGKTTTSYYIEDENGATLDLNIRNTKGNYDMKEDLDGFPVLTLTRVRNTPAK